MVAQTLDLEVDQGSTFIWNITVMEQDGLSPLNLSGYSLRGMVRKYYSDTNPVETFTVLVADVSSGIVRVSLTSTETAAMTKGRYVYDLELEDATGTVTKLYKGSFIVYPEATK